MKYLAVRLSKTAAMGNRPGRRLIPSPAGGSCGTEFRRIAPEGQRGRAKSGSSKPRGAAAPVGVTDPATACGRPTGAAPVPAGLGGAAGAATGGGGGGGVGGVV